MPENKPYEKQAITNLQRYLRQLSYEDAAITRPPVDGIFEKVTEQSLVDFQNKYGFEPSGIADRTTWDALFNAYLNSINFHSPSTPVFIFSRNPDGFALRPGDSSIYVMILQYMLRELSVDYGDVLNVEQTNEYDEMTSQAIKIFQRINSIAENGITDILTWNRVTQAYNRRANEYVQ